MEPYTLRVLVVEDYADAADSLSMLLRLYGYDVAVVTDGPSACRAVQASQPDVVLLDIGLPGMSGWLVAEQIREQCSWKRPLIVAVTGYSTDADQVRSEQAGIDLHLVKPVDPEQLKNLLSRFESVVSVPASA